MNTNHWFKFYGGEYLSDPKIKSLTPQERSCWITLLAMASVASDPGKIEYLTIDVLLTSSGIVWDPYHPEDWDKGQMVLEKFSRMKMLKATENCVEIINWTKRQERILTDAERAKNYRDRKQERHLNVTPNVTNVTLDKSRVDKSRVDKNIQYPNWLDKEAWKEWEEYRKEIKKPLTQRAIELQWKDLEKDKENQKARIEQSIMNRWTGLFPLKENSRKLTKGGIEI